GNPSALPPLPVSGVSTATRKVTPMHKLILAGAAVLALSAALPAAAQDNDAAAGAGAAVGATTGGTIGFLRGGPVGAIIGGFSGAVIGGSVSDAAVSYAGNHPVEQVYLDTDLD